MSVNDSRPLTSLPPCHLCPPRDGARTLEPLRTWTLLEIFTFPLRFTPELPTGRPGWTPVAPTGPRTFDPGSSRSRAQDPSSRVPRPWGTPSFEGLGIPSVSGVRGTPKHGSGEGSADQPKHGPVTEQVSDTQTTYRLGYHFRLLRDRSFYLLPVFSVHT